MVGFERARIPSNALESWVLAQHEYWSVGRALADACAGAHVLLRLKVILEEGGWTLAPGAVVGNPPEPTRDRLQTAITLARECRLPNVVDETTPARSVI